MPEMATTASPSTLKFTSAVRAIFHDSKGNYWIGSHNEGLCLYNGLMYQYFTTIHGLPDNQIISIQEDSTGKIWIGTAKGICFFHSGIFTTYPTNTLSPITDWNKTKGDLWFYARQENGIYRFDGTNINYLVFPTIPNDVPDNSYAVTDLSIDNNRAVWIATYAALFHYHAGKLTTYNHKTLKLKPSDLLHIRSVLADSKGRIWIGNNGIGILLKKGDTITNFSEQNNLIHQSSKRRGDKSPPGTLEHVFAIQEDAEGNIWFGDRDTGAWKYNGKTITNYPISQSQSMIRTIYKDNNNNLLFGLADGSIFNFNGKTFQKQF